MTKRQRAKTAAGALINAAAIVALNACGQGAAAETGADEKEPAPSVSSWHSATLQDARRVFQENYQQLTRSDCSADCGPDLTKVFTSAFLLKKLMAKSGAPRSTYTEPIGLFAELEKGFSTAAGLTGEARLAPMLEPASKLNNWLNAHPFV